jgi:hypothetical protein
MTFTITPAPNGSGHAPTFRFDCATLAIAQAATQNAANMWATPMQLLDGSVPASGETRTTYTPAGLTLTTLASALSPPTK